MAAGLPVVISDTDGCRETVNHEQDGLKVPVGSIRPYAEAVMRIEGDDALRSELIVNGKSKALSQDWITIASKYARVYENLVKNETQVCEPMQYQAS